MIHRVPYSVLQYGTFSSALLTHGLLGLTGFFSNFDVTFDSRLRECRFERATWERQTWERQTIS